ncbi:MAG: DUF3794 domain-containing protein, partial [Clostridia bacterium]|nr:DUF3794 domain-containing protein [Clostridia bacterium]
MDLKDAKCALRMPKCVCDEFEERAVDMDVVLPDYCPEIAAILKCSMRPIITARFQSGDRYTVDGVTLLRVLYLTDDRAEVHCYEATQPFSIGFHSEEAVHHLLEVKPDYVHCRAVGPRRVDIHGAFRVYLKEFAEQSVQVFCDPQESDVFCKTTPIVCTVPVSENEKSFLVSDIVDLGAQADRLIYSDASVISSEVKVLTNKLILKGVLGVKALLCRDGHTSCHTQEIPFSQIMDVPGLCEEWTCDVDVNVGENETVLQRAENGSCLLAVDCKLTAYARCGETQAYAAVLDAYSVKRPLLCETMPLHLSQKQTLSEQRRTLHSTAALPEKTQEIVDLWGDLKNYEYKDGTLTCCVAVGFIARDSDGYVEYYERTVDMELSCEACAKPQRAQLVRVSGVVNGNALHVQADILLCDCVAEQTVHAVSQVVEDVQHPYPRNAATIRIVYADPGQTVWEIAKAHRSCVQDIVAENDLLTECIE